MTNEVTRRVQERIAAMATEVAQLGEYAADGSFEEFVALLNGHAAAISALNEIAVMLAAEIDRLKSHDAPS